MSVKIKNITKRPVSFRLNSGRTLHLAPGATSPEILDVEVNNNAQVQKLEDRHVIALRQVEKKEQPVAGSEKEEAESTTE